MTTHVAAILRTKGHKVVTVPPEVTVGALIKTLAEHRIGAVPVVEHGEHLVGIVSERDVVRALADGATALDRSVRSVMTANVQTCSLEDSVFDLMNLMTRGRFRHLPVVERGLLVGIISIGDVVKERLGEAEYELDNLKSYIAS